MRCVVKSVDVQKYGTVGVSKGLIDRQTDNIFHSIMHQNVRRLLQNVNT